MTPVSPPPSPLIGYGVCNVPLTILRVGSLKRYLVGVSGESSCLLLTPPILVNYRLGSYEEFLELVPDPFMSLLPPSPQPMFLYDEQTANEGTTIRVR